MAKVIETIDGLKYVTLGDGIPVANLTGSGGDLIQDNFVELGSRVKKSNLEAVATPTINDDITAGYAVGSLWIYNGSLYVCLDNTAAAAVWDKVIQVTDTGTSAGDIPVLDGSGKLAASVIPPIALSEFLGTVANEAAMLALTGQRGDWCTRSDTSASYILESDDPTSANNWTALTSPGSVLSVNGYTGVVTLVKGDVDLANVPNTDATLRANHSGMQAISTVTDLQATLDAKLTQALLDTQIGVPDGIARLDSNGDLSDYRLIVRQETTASAASIVFSAGEICQRTDGQKAVTIGDNSTTGGVAISVDLNSSACVFVKSTGTPAQNGTALIAAYAAAKILTPNGSALSATNRATLLIGPGKYDLVTASLNVDTQFVDIVGIGEPDDVFITSAGNGNNSGTLNRAANDIRIANLTLEMTTPAEDVGSADSAAYYVSPSNTYTLGQFWRVHTGGTGYGMRIETNYGDTWRHCVNNGSSGFGGGFGTASGTFISCTHNGSNGFGSGGTASGTFINCRNTGGAGFGGVTISGTFINCVNTGSDGFGGSFFGDITSTAVLLGCTNTGSYGVKNFAAKAVGCTLDGLPWFGNDAASKQTTVNGSTSGTAVFGQVENSAASKRVVVRCISLLGTASYTFPTAFTTTPVILTTDGPAASVVTALSTTAMTITGATTNGIIIVEGF